MIDVHHQQENNLENKNYFLYLLKKISFDFLRQMPRFCVKVRQILLFQLVIYVVIIENHFYPKFYYGDSIRDTVLSYTEAEIETTGLK
jgi:hypothetical protein